MTHAVRKRRGLWRVNIVRVGIIRIVASDGEAKMTNAVRQSERTNDSQRDFTQPVQRTS